MSDLISSFVEITLPKPENFLTVKETLTRIGVASHKDKKLYQSCHILHKKGQYYIVHFKELFMLDGKQSDFTDEDKGRRNTIVNLLNEWEMVKVKDEEQIQDPVAGLGQIKVLPFKEKENWELIPKYRIGGKK